MTSASRATCSASRARCAADEASVGRRSTAAPICASTRASTASVLARWPRACAKRRACTGLTRTSGNPASIRASSKARCHRPVGSSVTARTGTSTHAISALKPAASLGNRAAWPAGTTDTSRCVFEMSTPTGELGIFPAPVLVIRACTRTSPFRAISEFPKWRKYLISLCFRSKSSVRPVHVGGHVKARNSGQASTAVTAVSVSWSVAVSG